MLINRLLFVQLLKYSFIILTEYYFLYILDSNNVEKLNFVYSYQNLRLAWRVLWIIHVFLFTWNYFMSFFHICESTSCFSCSIEPWPDISVLRWCAVNWDLLLSVSFPDSSLLTEHWVVETVSNTTTLHLHPPPPWGHIENICRNDKISQKKNSFEDSGEHI